MLQEPVQTETAFVEETIQSKAVRYTSRGLYMLAAACFVFGIVFLFKAAGDVNLLFSQTEMTSLTAANILYVLRELPGVLLTWMIVMSIGLVCWVAGVFIHSFVE